MPNLLTGRFDAFGGAWGYGYSYIDERFFSTAVLGAGPGVQIQQLQRNDQNNSQNYSLAVKIILNLATGWNYKNCVGGLKLLFDSLSSNVAGTEVVSNLWSTQIIFALRM